MSEQPHNSKKIVLSADHAVLTSTGFSESATAFGGIQPPKSINGRLSSGRRVEQDHAMVTIANSKKEDW